ncbi:glycoside hydrolase family 3 protein [Paenibacillus sedimenti]|uniref:Glycoside hydrolase family 3 C-terminal domain-containing protein n=1 Tax=Paenibacillus sedimenti TaxID=2770274 RepID=A0A926KVV3_9BACL|nr:glycoside hydrolase family 3 protein [Paenibacillus sedimenti]MBD0384258.1 glycoside hydrolase family 3 C-terminal domain-containing protein [Paenibacillus sedimenti]
MSILTGLPFQNTELSLDERVADLISRFTLEEKINLMTQYQTEVPRLGVKPYKHGTEGAHGVAWLGEATVFPQNIGLACTWNPDLLREIGSAIGDEARVYYQKNPAINGLTIWAPTVDMERDPRWGRTEEAYGEDPYLTGRISTELVKGMQGPHPFYLKTVATLKHFLGNNNEINRGECSVSIDPRNMREYYLKAFEPAFREGGALSMMTAYNAVNGTLCNLNPDVNRIVKGEWGMQGFVVSDAGDVLGTVRDHHYMQSYAMAVAESVKNGIDSITDDQEITLRAIRDAIELGLLGEEDLDHALSNTFRVRFRLGEFDPEANNPYANIPETKLCAPEHAELSLRAARESIVLLKNDGILPLKKDLKKVAVIGPLANTVYTDWYSGTPNYRITPLQGIREKMADKALGNVDSKSEYNNVESKSEFNDAESKSEYNNAESKSEYNNANDHAVVFEEGCDRIRLRSRRTGGYVGLSAGAQPLLVADRAEAANAALFDRADWGWGSVTLRAAASGKFVTETDDGRLAAIADEARGWFVKEAFGFEALEGAEAAMKSWAGRHVAAGEGGVLTVGEAGHTDGVDRFEIDVVRGGIRAAVDAAKSADAAVVFVGNNPFINGKECVDRPDLTLPPAQEALIRAVFEANPNTVVVIVGSYPCAVNWQDEHMPAMLYSSHAGQELGHAVADVLFGDYNPAGRLNMTWYRSIDQLPDLMDYDIIKGKRTYQYFDGDVLYPFGHGLSYTNFRYSDLSLSEAEINADGLLQVSIRIENTGSQAGDEVVQFYVRANESSVRRPLKTLKGFQRVHLLPGHQETVTFTLPATELAFWDVTRDRYCVESGSYSVMIGRSSGNYQAEASFTVRGEEVPPRQLDAAVRAINYDDYADVYLDECREGGGACLRSRGETGWIAFRNADLGRGVHGFEARVAHALSGAQIEIRLDAPDGPLAGVCDVPPTGGWQAWTTVTAPVSGSGITGIRDVYLCFAGTVQISWFRLHSQE